MALSIFDPLVAEWFTTRFSQATEPQLLGWPEIAAGNNVLISAPTGSGKTLAAFLICIDQLVRAARAGALADETEVVYISPLKALSNDVHRNLEVPLAEISALAESAAFLSRRFEQLCAPAIRPPTSVSRCSRRRRTS